MDKYEFNVKVEQIRKLINKGEYETAMKIADTIDWKRVRNANLLSMISHVYERNEQYQDAKDIMQLAYERAPIENRFLYKLTELTLKEGNLDEADSYYREFCAMAGDDSKQYLLRYMILKAINAPIKQMIRALESYTTEELDEEYLYELAELYHETGDTDNCIRTCDKIIRMFGPGKYCDKAMTLKQQYTPLNSYQMELFAYREKYEEKLWESEQPVQNKSVTEAALKRMKTQTESESNLYEGTKQYIFISYSHDDSEHVLPIVKRMQSKGYRVWYDDGIVPGKKWREVITQHIRGSAYFVAFVSENYMKSEMCKNEFVLAQEYSKRWLPIYLEKTELPDELALYFCRIQAIQWYSCLERDDFYSRIDRVDGIGCCKEK